MTTLAVLQAVFGSLCAAAAGYALWNRKQLRSNQIVGWTIGLALVSALVAQRIPSILLWSQGREVSGVVVQRICPVSGNHFLVYQFTAVDGTVHQGKKRVGGGPGECKVPIVGDRSPVTYLEAKPEINAWQGAGSDMEFLLLASLLLGLVIPIANQVRLSRHADA